MKKSQSILILIVMCLIAILISISWGSVSISFSEIVAIIHYKLVGLPLADHVQETTVSILWFIRLPRILMAYIVGAALAVSGTVMQSILRNPLASLYTLGVSSGASLSAALYIVLGISLSFLGFFALPLFGFLGGFITILIIMSFTAQLDKNMSNQTIVLVGMVFSLFVNGLLTLVIVLSREHIEPLIFWQMEGFSGRNRSEVFITFLMTVFCIIFLMGYAREMDLLSFGEEQALSVGVETKKVKWQLISICALLTGTAVAFVGIIGFIDLIAPRVTQKIFGSSHILVLPMSALFGGVLMVTADLIGRTVLAPQEIPVGAVPALIGTSFFAYIYFHKRKGSDLLC